ncbi:orexin/Hypocretin receptor type 1-like [Haliotis rubra]|uniref:orexin/Hypocretin receptor type 1-like n=1 Tax=Haliotis rubra TaxID=36100 RepID=UPI001EE59A87|nr:orexin/Hypocretin receptor type 1-like [Haliotis rubra]XP_046547399.1 orexin/Hypocretin receptor type 1-like [Haliotis rubra]
MEPPRDNSTTWYPSSIRLHTDNMSVSTTSTHPNIDKSEYLDGLSNEEATKLLPVIVYLGILMIVGLVGNCLVLYVHFRKFNPSTTRTYVVSLAFFDLLSCLFSVPGEIVDLRFSFTFEAVALCKAERFCTTFSSLASGFTLMAVAVDRYRRICHPLKQQLQTNGARKVVLGACLLSVLFSWPVSVIYGKRSVDTEYQAIKGIECSTDDEYRVTKYPTIYNASLFLIFIISFGTMIAVYTLIGRKVLQQKKFRKHSTSKSLQRSRSLSGSDKMPVSPSSQRSPPEMDRPSYDEGPSEYSIASIDPHAKDVSLSRKPSFMKRIQKGAQDSRSKKTTFMLFLITMVFVLSFLPHLILKGVQAAKKTFLGDASTAALIFYNIFVRSYFLNSISNAFIYGFCSPRFRKESKALFRALICQKRCASLSISKPKV